MTSISKTLIDGTSSTLTQEDIDALDGVLDSSSSRAALKTALSTKAESADLTSGLAGKADAAATTAAIDANASAIAANIAALATKADAASTSAALAGKANLSIQTLGDADLTVPAGTTLLIVGAQITAPRTLVLPDATTLADKRLTIVDGVGLSGAFALTIAAATGQTIQGAASYRFQPNESVTLVASGGGWRYDVESVSRGGTGATNKDLARQQLEVPVARPSILATRRRGYGSSTNYNTYTFASVFALEAPWDWIRFAYLNVSTTAAITIDNTYFAPSAKYNNGVDPQDASGNPVAFRQVTTNNAGASNVYPDGQTGGAATGLTIPPTTDSLNPSIAFTDWMQVPSLARAHAGASLPLVMVRNYSTTVTNGPMAANPNAGGFIDWSANPSVNLGRLMQGFYKSGNFASGAVTTGWNNNNYVQVAAIQTLSRTRGHSVMFLGDSLTQGWVADSTNMNSFGHIACSTLSTPSKPVHHLACGWQGQTHAQFMARGRREFDAYQPDVVCICVASPNGSASAFTSAQWDAMLANSLSLAAYVERQGKTPILMTMVPFNYSAAADANRKAVNDRVRAMAGSRFLVMDNDSVVTDGNTPAKTLQIYQATDNQHLNVLAGQTIAQQMTIPVLRQALGLAS